MSTGAAITTTERDGHLVLALEGSGFAYVMAVTPEGLLGHCHYGPALADPAEAVRHLPRGHRDGVAMHEDARDLPLSEFPQEYPVAGASDFRHCALEAETAGGVPASTLRYRGHAVAAGKPDLDGLPSADGAGARTLAVTMADALTGLAAELRYTVWPDQGVLARSVRLVNEGEAPITLRRALSAAYALPPGPREALHLHGTWAREFQAERVPLSSAQLVVESTRGASSAAHHPFLALLAPGTTETAGEVLAATLAYSGNHRHAAERGEFGDARLSAGINPEGFSWHLAPGAAFCTPEALSVWTRGGLGAMSRAWHPFVREKVTPKRWRGAARPSYLNTWEAAYFGVDEARVLSLADRAASLGLDMLVLDDGWFEGRTSDRTGLGPWEADPERFPSGIDALAARVRAKGLRFGLWVEPEMVSPGSLLLAENPGWALGVPGRTPSLGRGQLTLDLGQAAVREHVYGAVARRLASGDVGYVKWDMNRPMTEVGSAALPPERQREAAHRYVLGLYEVLGRLTAGHPDVLFEACASGGARFDLGVLRSCAQGWPSDMVDPVGRAAIVSGASLLYPPDVMAAYIGPSPNHQDGRVTGLQARFDAGALLAAQGVSLDEAALDAHADELRALFEGARARAARRLGGRFDRLAWGADEAAWQLTSADGGHVDVVSIRVLSRPNPPRRKACLRGLDPEARYRAADGTPWSGEALMGLGLPLPEPEAPSDFATLHVELERVR